MLALWLALVTVLLLVPVVAVLLVSVAGWVVGCRRTRGTRGRMVRATSATATPHQRASS